MGMRRRYFPVMLCRWDYRRFADCPKYIPWEYVEPHEWQAQKNHGQSLQRLAERGGLDPIELVAVLERRSWRAMSMRSAIDRLKQIIDQAVQ